MRALSSDKVHVWYRALDELPSASRLARWLALLSEEERARYHAFRFEKDKILFAAAHALVRLALSEYLPVQPACWRFETNAWGKPSVLNHEGKGRIAFNLSHARGMVAVGIALTHAVGLDVEWTDRGNKLSEIARYAFSPEELAYFEATPSERQSDVFFRFWTLKEAYIKARGQGLSIALDSFSFQLEDGGNPEIRFAADHWDQTNGWSFFEFRPSTAHRLAVAVQHRESILWEVDLKDARSLGLDSV